MNRIDQVKGVSKYIVAFICGIIFLFIFQVTTLSNKGEDRVDRFEELLEFKEYSLYQHSVHENMTVVEVRRFYNLIQYPTYKRVFIEMPINYVCDGTRSDLFHFMKK